MLQARLQMLLELQQPAYAYTGIFSICVLRGTVSLLTPFSLCHLKNSLTTLPRHQDNAPWLVRVTQMEAMPGLLPCDAIDDQDIAFSRDLNKIPSQFWTFL